MSHISMWRIYKLCLTFECSFIYNKIFHNVCLTFQDMPHIQTSSAIEREARRMRETNTMSLLTDAIGRSDVVHSNIACHTFKRVISHTYKWVVSHTHTNEKYHTHIQTCNVAHTYRHGMSRTHIDKECHTHIQMRNVTHTYRWVMSHTHIDE